MKLLILLIFILASQARKIFLDYSSFSQERHLIRLFPESYNQFYADLGAYDPLIYSNTLNFYARGWKGVNVQANPARASRFYTARPSTTTINMAVGNQEKFATLLELPNDSASTISLQYLQFMRKEDQSLKEIQKISIPQISMGKICQRYFYRRPILISMDIQGFQGQGLKGNNWTNPSCRPDVFIVEIFDQKLDQNGTRYGRELPQTILAQNGYKQLRGSFQHNKIFVLESVFPMYERRYRQFNYLNYEMIKYTTLKAKIYSHFGMTPENAHYNPESDKLFFYISVAGQPIIPQQLNQFSNKVRGQALSRVLELQDRNIVILQFDVERTQIFLRQHELISFNQVQMTGILNFHFWHFQFAKTGKEGQIKSYHIYIFDHTIERGKYPRVITRQNGVLDYLKKQAKSFQSVNDKQSKVIYHEFDQQKFKKAEQQRSKLLDEITQLKVLVNQKNSQLNLIEKNQANIIMILYAVALMMGFMLLASFTFCLITKLCSRKKISRQVQSFENSQQA